MQLDGYIRVSRVGGRAGETFISPQVQRERIEAYASLHGHTLVEVWEEMDESGANARRPMLQAVLERIDRGDTDGLIVAKLDRFARSLGDAVEMMRRIDQAGGKLVSVEDQFDTGTAIGRFAQHLLLALAELEHARVRDNWRVAQQHAVSRGIHVTPRVPVGYRRDTSGSRLEVDPVVGPVVREAFRRRAAGGGPAEIAQLLNQAGVATSYGNTHWTATTAGRLFRNRAYIGEARASRGVSAMGAHEPLVDEETYALAQVPLRRRPPAASNGRYLLSGMIRCHACRYVMTARPHPTGGVAYACKSESSAGRCPSPAAVTAPVIDEWVTGQLLARLQGGDRVEVTARAAGLDAARELVRAAEVELAAWRDTTEIASLDRDVYLDGLRARVARRDEAHQQLSRALADAQLVALPDMLDVADLWPRMTVAEQRVVVTAAIDCVVLRRGRTGISQRATIMWRGEAPDDLPRRGRVTPLRAFDDLDMAVGEAGGDD